MKQKQKGFTVVEVAIVIAVITLIGLVGWLMFSRKTDVNKGVSSSSKNTKTASSANKTPNSTESIKTTPSQNSDTSSNTAKAPAPVDSSTKLLNGAVSLTLSSDWTKKSDSEINTSLYGHTYVATFSLTDNDTLDQSSPYAENGAGLARINSQNSTGLMVWESIRNQYYGWVFVGACPTLCSPRIGSQYLFVLLSDQTDGTTQPLYFRNSNSDANTILGQFITIIKSSNI